MRRNFDWTSSLVHNEHAFRFSPKISSNYEAKSLWFSSFRSCVRDKSIINSQGWLAIQLADIFGGAQKKKKKPSEALLINKHVVL